MALFSAVNFSEEVQAARAGAPYISEGADSFFGLFHLLPTGTDAR